MILSGNLDSSTWASIRAFVRDGDDGKASDLIRYGLRGEANPDVHVVDTLNDAKRLEGLA